MRIRSRIYLKKEAYYVLSSQSAINIRMMIEHVIDPDADDIIFLNTARKFNSSTGECLMGVAFDEPEGKERFEERCKLYRLKLTELKASDPLLKVLL